MNQWPFRTEMWRFISRRCRPDRLRTARNAWSAPATMMMARPAGILRSHPDVMRMTLLASTRGRPSGSKSRTGVHSPLAGLPGRPDAPVKRRRDALIGHRAAVLLHTPHKGMQRLGSERLGRCEPMVAAFIWRAPRHGH